MPEISNPDLIRGLLDAVSSDKARPKFAAAKALRILSERSPDLIYPHFHFFENLLGNKNSILRWNAILILGNLAPVDGERKLDRMIGAYLAPIAGPHLIDAANTIRGASAIAAAKPHLAETIARHIVKTERGTYATPECRNVALGHAVTALESLLPMIANKDAIRHFVSRQLDNTRPATRKKAERFLRRWQPDQSRALSLRMTSKASAT